MTWIYRCCTRKWIYKAIHYCFIVFGYMMVEQVCWWRLKMINTARMSVFYESWGLTTCIIDCNIMPKWKKQYARRLSGFQIPSVKICCYINSCVCKVCLGINFLNFNNFINIKIFVILLLTAHSSHFNCFVILENPQGKILQMLMRSSSVLFSVAT